MTQILIDQDFGHPPERIWRALTEPALLSEWFTRTESEPSLDGGLRLTPDGPLDFLGPLMAEMVELDAPRQIVMLWRGEQMHSRVVWELTPIRQGSRLRVSQTGFLGVDGARRQLQLLRAYDELLGGRLPAVLDRLATAPAGAAPAPLPELVVPSPGLSWPDAEQPDDLSDLPDFPKGLTDVPDDLRELSDVADDPRELSDVPDDLAWLTGGDLPRLPDELAGPPGDLSGSGWDRPERESEWRQPDPGLAGAAGAAGSVGRWRRWRLRTVDRLHAVPHHIRGRLLVLAVTVVLAVLATVAVGRYAEPALTPLPPSSAVPDFPLVTVPPPGATETQPAPDMTGTSDEGGAPAPGPVRPGGAPADRDQAPAPGQAQAQAQAPPREVPPPPRQPAADTPDVAEPALPAWFANFRTIRLDATGFAAEITITNAGTRPASGWSVDVTLPAGARLLSVDRAAAVQRGQVVTFTARNPAKVGPKGIDRFGFQVSGGSGPRPIACRIDLQRCAGL